MSSRCMHNCARRDARHFNAVMVTASVCIPSTEWKKLTIELECDNDWRNDAIRILSRSTSCISSLRVLGNQMGRIAAKPKTKEEVALANTSSTKIKIRL